jgi:hypothetical protein
VGLSHVLHPGRWVRFFEHVLGREWGPFLISLMTWPLGLVIVLLHNDWSLRPALAVTVVGWLMVAKAGVYAVAPGAARVVAARKRRGPRAIVVAGVGRLLLAALVAADPLSGARSP